MIIVPELDIFLNELILDYFSKGYIYKGVYKAAKIGHLELVDFFISRNDASGIDNHWNLAMRGAAHGGHLSLVEYFISRNYASGIDNDWNWAMSGAAHGEHFSLVEFFQHKINEENNN